MAWTRWRRHVGHTTMSLRNRRRLQRVGEFGPSGDRDRGWWTMERRRVRLTEHIDRRICFSRMDWMIVFRSMVRFPSSRKEQKIYGKASERWPPTQSSAGRCFGFSTLCYALSSQRTGVGGRRAAHCSEQSSLPRDVYLW